MNKLDKFKNHFDRRSNSFPRRGKYFIWTIGCQMNKAESQRIASYLDSLGYQMAHSFKEADLLVLNTCVVRQKAEDKVLGTLAYVKGLKQRKAELSILVTGCFVNSHTESLTRQFPYVDLFFKPGDYPELTRWAGARHSACPQEITLTTSLPCAFVPIIQGCNKFCSYCIVPYRRGRERSRPFLTVVAEVTELAKQGVKQVTLLGQNIASYGHDLPGHPTLADLLARLNEIGGLSRIRFLTNYPTDISLRLIKAVASLDKACEHLDIAAQSGDNDILKAMRRSYTVEQFRELVDTVRHYIPRVSLSTDIIVGFPGETEEQFEHTYSLLKELRFDVVHVAAYSPRRGTIAWRKYPDSIPAEIKMERLKRIEHLQAQIAGEINSRFHNEVAEVLVEGRKGDKWYGRSRSDKLVFFSTESAKREAGKIKNSLGVCPKGKSDDNDLYGKLVNVRIEKTSPWSLQGKVELRLN